MAPDPAFLALMPSTCTIAAPTALDGWGKRTWGPAVSYRCRYEPTDRLVRGNDNRETHVVGSLYIYGSPEVTPDHRVVGPDGNVLKVASVDRHYDERGASHVVISIGT